MARQSAFFASRDSQRGGDLERFSWSIVCACPEVSGDIPMLFIGEKLGWESECKLNELVKIIPNSDFETVFVKG